MSEAYLSQLRLRTDSSVRTVLGLFQGESESATDRRHKLLWSAFAKSRGDRSPRDFLWRSTTAGRFLAVSRRAPQGNDLLEVERAAPFAPKLHAGSLLRFSLKAAASKSSPGNARLRRRGKKSCLLEAARRDGIPVEQAIRTWFARQGERHGFALTEQFWVDSTSIEAVRPDISQGVFEIAGKIRVVDPEALSTCLVSGLGRLKAFGCGMLILGTSTEECGDDRRSRSTATLRGRGTREGKQSGSVA